MNAIEKEVLKKIHDNPQGLLSQTDLINCLPNGNTKISHSLIAKGYIEEVSRLIKATQVEVTFYRLTEKGIMEFEPLRKRFWFLIKSDTRTILVSAITAIVTSIITILIERWIKP